MLLKKISMAPDLSDPELPSNATVIPEMCDFPSGYRKYNDSCYRLVNETLTFNEAQASCGSDNAWVTRARDGFYNSLLTLMINADSSDVKPVWIGMRLEVRCSTMVSLS